VPFWGIGSQQVACIACQEHAYIDMNQAINCAGAVRLTFT